MSFTVISTTYTKRIIQQGDGGEINLNAFFNDRGTGDHKLLSLIHEVRKDAREWMEREGLTESGEGIDFFNLFEVPKEDEVIAKVDVSAAYWSYALKRGIITPKTNEKLIKLYGVSWRRIKQKKTDHVDGKQEERERSVGEFKAARLKALGSLATTKVTREYENGYIVSEQIKEESTKIVYMEICRGIDRLMKECHQNVPGCIYYYWDCIFVKKEFSAQAIEFFKQREYNTSMKITKIDFIRMGDIGYLISTLDDTIYMTRKENKHLLPRYEEQ